MNYLREINAFYDWLETNRLSLSAIALWHALMHTNNKAGWMDEFAVAVSVLCVKTGLSPRGVTDARNELKVKNRILWRSRKGSQSAIYRLVPLSAIIACNTTDNRADNRADNTATLNKQNETKEKNIPPKFPDDSQEMILALKLRAYILKNNDKARVPKDLTGWAVEIDKMIRIDGRPVDQLAAVMKFSQESTFWASNILSVKKLREKYDTLYLQSKAQPRCHPPGDIAEQERKNDLAKKLYLAGR